MSDYLPEIVITIVVILLSSVFLFGIYKAMSIRDDRVWNDGHCDVCGGVWQYEQAVGHRSSTSYIYICNGCGKRIEINEVR